LDVVQVSVVVASVFVMNLMNLDESDLAAAELKQNVGHVKKN